MENEETENKKPELSPIQKALREIREKQPVIWEEILKSNICPYNFRLHASCALTEDSCKKCWENALNIVLADNIDITQSGSYECKDCKKNLVFDRVTKEGTQFWHCPSCNKHYRIQLSGDITAVTLINPDEAKKQQEQAADKDSFPEEGTPQDNPF